MRVLDLPFIWLLLVVSSRVAAQDGYDSDTVVEAGADPSSWQTEELQRSLAEGRTRDVNLGPLSAPAVHDAHLPVSKFTNRSAMAVEDVIFGTDVSGLMKKSECEVDVELVWQNQVSSGVYATAAIATLLPDGSKQIVVSAFHRDVTILDSDGHHMPGFPVALHEDSFFHASPVLLDYNRDGILDVVMVDVGGEIYVVNGHAGAMGALLREVVHVPKLKVRKFWFMGLATGVQQAGPGQSAENKHVHRADRMHRDDPDDRTAKSASHVEAELEADLEEMAASDGGGVSRRLLQDGATVRDQLADGLTDEARESLNLFAPSDDYTEAIIYESDDDENFYPPEEEYVYVDAHVLATPAAVDLNGDGVMDLVMAVSYFFDEDDYANRPHLFAALGSDVKIRNYVAGGVVAYDIANARVLWTEHLDLTTDFTAQKAYIYSSPTVVDLDADGEMEVIVGSSLGFIYALHAVDGSLVEGFPITMSEIQAQIGVEDVNGDGQLEMIAMDKKGNVLCFDSKGREVWEHSIQGFSAQGATFGDVNGDGMMDVVIGTLTGWVWALRGDTGDVLPRFPFKTEARIIAPITLVNLDRAMFVRRRTGGGPEELPQNIEDEIKAGPKPVPTTPAASAGASGSNVAAAFGIMPPLGLHLVFPSFDGHVYIVNGRTGCVTKVDIGEQSYGMVLVDDILTDGRVSLLATTMNGNIYCFSTSAPFTPLKAWPSQTHSLNGFTSRDNYHGLFVTKQSRQHREVLGRTFVVEFEIVDRRSKRSTKSPVYYFVQISAGAHVLYSHTYFVPGRYSEEIEALPFPSESVISVVMWNEHRQFFMDQFSIGMNMQYYRTLKWLVILPFLLLTAVLLFSKQSSSLPRP